MLLALPTCERLMNNLIIIIVGDILRELDDTDTDE